MSRVPDSKGYGIGAREPEFLTTTARPAGARLAPGCAPIGRTYGWRNAVWGNRELKALHSQAPALAPAIVPGWLTPGASVLDTARRSYVL